MDHSPLSHSIAAMVRRESVQAHRELDRRQEQLQQLLDYNQTHDLDPRLTGGLLPLPADRPPGYGPGPVGRSFPLLSGPPPLVNAGLWRSRRLTSPIPSQYDTLRRL